MNIASSSLPVAIARFHSVRPQYTLEQDFTLRWLAQVHARAEAVRCDRAGQPCNEAEFAARLERRLERFGCGANYIHSRGSALADCSHTRFEEMEVYRVHEQPEGAGMLARSRVFGRVALGVLRRILGEQACPPRDLIHVTCTGYAAPSAAQRWVAERGLGEQTRVTHAYHMGCYAALPALRIAGGFVRGGGAGTGSKTRPNSAQLVHTELCSLHMDPLLHDPEQLVVQSLFADGFIAYELIEEAELTAAESRLSLLALDEWIVPESAECMTWICSDHGMHMTLAREVPQRLAAQLRPFVEHLGRQAGLDRSELAKAVLAVHPGGPRILDLVRDTLEREESSIAESRRVLSRYGNMSSATLPHVWMSLLADRDLPSGTPILSLAFGPGLTACGAVLRKRSA